jgi:hypothetical protein
MKQTAVDYLFDKLSTLYPFKDALLEKRALQEAKAMEKEQIVDAFKNGRISCLDSTSNKVTKAIHSQDYYNQTYQKQ